MYVYEGKDYSKEPSREDRKAFDQLLDLQKTLTEETSKEGRALRNKANVRQKTWQGTWCSFICLWRTRLMVFSLPMTCRRHIKRFGCQCSKVGSWMWGLENSAILITDQRYHVQGTYIYLGHKTTYFMTIGIWWLRPVDKCTNGKGV